MKKIYTYKRKMLAIDSSVHKRLKMASAMIGESMADLALKYINMGIDDYETLNKSKNLI